jgi:hypothetical protein
MRQQTLAAQGSFEKYGRKTRREKFLEEADQIMPWAELLALIDPYYPKPGNGRPPIGLGIMLRIYFLQHWFNLSDPAAEEALYDSPALRRFAGIDLGRAPAPDETSILNFRPGVCHECSENLQMLYQRWEKASRSRLSGVGFKPPGAAAFKRRGGERPRKRRPRRTSGER